MSSIAEKPVKRLIKLRNKGSDREAFRNGDMMERIVKVEKDVEYIKSAQNEFLSKLRELTAALNNFVDKADEEYIHRREYEEFKRGIGMEVDDQKEVNRWTRDNITTLIKEGTLYVLLAAILGKQMGWF